MATHFFPLGLRLGAGKTLLSKRGITGSFHPENKAHLRRYCDEFSFRWNERKISDEVRT